MPYSPLGISKLMRRETKNWPAGPKRSAAFLALFPSFHHGLPRTERRQGAAPQRRSQIATCEFATRSRADTRVPTHTRGVRRCDEPHRRVRERRTTAATRTRQGSTTTTSWFLPSCELRSIVSVHVQALGIFYLFIFNPS